MNECIIQIKSKEGKTLYLADRGKQKEEYWVENPELAYVYEDSEIYTARERAEFKCSFLYYNEPKVVGYEKALKRYRGEL